MSFLKKIKDINQKGVGQALFDATMSAVDKAKSGEDGPAPILRYMCEQGYSGSNITGALKAAQPVIGSGEVELFWTAWMLKYEASPGWHPQQHARGGAATVVHCVRTEGRIVIVSNDGALVLEHQPKVGERPEIKLVNEVTFGIVATEDLDMTNPVVSMTAKISNRLGLKDLSAAQVYRQIANERMQIDPNLVPKSYNECSGAVVVLPASPERGSISLVVLSTELDGIAAALSG